MIWIIISAVLVLTLSFWLGYKKLFYLDQISARAFLLFCVITVSIFLLLRLSFDMGYLPEPVAAGIMTGMYSSIAGFLFGAALQQFLNKTKLREIEYVNRSFLTDILPNLIALTLIIAGIARSTLLNEQNITPIRVTAGLSLIALGFFGMTLRLTPEFRKKGIVILDRNIDWDDFVAYRWYGDNVIEIDFNYQEGIRSYRTVIPPDDQIKIENLLSRKMIEKLEDGDKI